MLAAFAERGVDVAGFDLLPRMVELACDRLRGRGRVVLADMTDFDLGRTFDGAVCPINTLLHLTPGELARHLDCMARHTSHYLVQVGLVDSATYDPFAGSKWEAERGDTKLKVLWEDEELDFERGLSRQRSRIEVLTGPRAGEVIEEIHDMTAWTPQTWHAAIEESPFTEAAIYDGGKKGERPQVDPGATGGLLWHELVRRTR